MWKILKEVIFLKDVADLFGFKNETLSSVLSI